MRSSPQRCGIIDVQPGDALHIRTQPTNGVALAGIALTPAAASDAPPMGEKQVGFVHDTNMLFSKFAVKQPEDVYSILQPYVDSHVAHIFYGTGVGTYSPLYDSPAFGWHGQEQQEFRADHRKRTAGVVRMLVEAGHDPLAMAVEYAHANGLQLWANHRISKNHELEQLGRESLNHSCRRVRATPASSPAAETRVGLRAPKSGRPLQPFGENLLLRLLEHENRAERKQAITPRPQGFLALKVRADSKPCRKGNSLPARLPPPCSLRSLRTSF